MTHEVIYEFEDQETEHQHIENISHGAIKLIDRPGLVLFFFLVYTNMIDEKIREEFEF